MAKVDVYQVITDRIIEIMEQGTVPWQRPWATPGEMPKNLDSGKEYRGINVFTLGVASSAHGSNYWLTYKQASKRGGQVRKGERGYPVVFWKWLQDKKHKGKRVPFLRYYTVFNATQCDGIELPPPPPPPAGADIVDTCAAIVRGYSGPGYGPRIETGDGTRACYNVLADTVTMPPRDMFHNTEGYWCTLFHELGHSTGHSKRLNRFDTLPDLHSYSKEELVAEFTAAYLCARGGITPPLNNNAAYLRGWLKAIKGDKKLLVSAAGKAQKAADMVLGVEWKTESEAA